MSDSMIVVENLSKRYLLGHRVGTEGRYRYSTLRDVIGREARNFVRKAADLLTGRQIIQGDEIEEFWALQDVSFEVKRGEIVGIIGRNGAGKSTLLKILSRITEPTKGRVVLRGRVASLLEVGTGFHPELTGRENIYLNGAILGMTRREIRKKFDEIVAFAEVEKFLDTPVKHYSSGMYVRLAFAVAAHLEPDILIVDEVLAVGDAVFQKKCLGKMSDFTGKEGRTILFVSHSMPAVRALCSRALILKNSRVLFNGTASEAISQYERESNYLLQRCDWTESEAPGDSAIKLLGLAVTQQEVDVAIDSSKPAFVTIDLLCTKIEEGLKIGFELFWQDGATLWFSHSTDGPPDDWPQLRRGYNRLVCELPANWLNAGRYSLAPRISIHNRRWIVKIPACLEFDVSLNHGQSPYWTSLSTGRLPGPLAPILPWRRGEAPQQRISKTQLQSVGS